MLYLCFNNLYCVRIMCLTRYMINLHKTAMKIQIQWSKKKVIEKGSADFLFLFHFGLILE